MVNGRLARVPVKDGIGLIVDEGVEFALMLTTAGLVYQVSRMLVKLVWRLKIHMALDIRPPQISAGFPGHG